MYIPRTFAEPELGVLRAFILAHPFAALVTSSGGGLYATHLPLILRDGDSGYGVLEGHVARANPHVSRLTEPSEAMVIFSGAHAHVTPTWYPSKAGSGGRVVPTWNYVAVHAMGEVRLRDDALFLRAHLARLSERHEGARGSDWTINDPPEEYFAQQLRAIVGLEVTIAGLEGKWKMSQNRPEADREGVVDGLRNTSTGHDADVATIVADKMMEAKAATSRVDPT